MPTIKASRKVKVKKKKKEKEEDKELRTTATGIAGEPVVGSVVKDKDIEMIRNAGKKAADKLSSGSGEQEPSDTIEKDGIIYRRSTKPVEENIMDARANTEAMARTEMERARLRNEQQLNQELKKSFGISDEEAAAAAPKTRRRKVKVKQKK